MKVTESNIHFVAYLLKKYISNGFTEQTFYPASKKANSVLKHFNIEYHWLDFMYKVEESVKSVFNKGVVEIDNFFSQYHYIRIHNNGEKVSNFYDLDFDDDDNFKAMVIHCGDEIKFNKGRITIKKEAPLHKDKVLSVITY